MTKKCFSSFVTYAAISAICLVTMHLMLLADVNKYVGLCIGSGILLVGFILYWIFRENSKVKYWIPLFLFVSAVGCGLALSSLYVHLGDAPKIIHSVCIWSAYVILFLGYCLFTNVALFRSHPRICLTVFGLFVLASGIVGILLSSKVIFSLALMMFILFIAYLATIVIHSRSHDEHIDKLTLTSFIGLFVIVIVVLIVMSEGNGLDGFDIGPTAGDGRDTYKRNPYEYF